MSVLLKKNDICARTVASQHRSLLQWVIDAVGGEQDGVDVEVPRVHVTTQGVSPRRGMSIILLVHHAKSLSFSPLYSPSAHLLLPERSLTSPSQSGPLLMYSN